MRKSRKQIALILFACSVLSVYPCSAQKTTMFSDVSKNEWYSDSVEYVFESGLMNGTEKTLFEPESSITRGMIVTIIYRMEGSPAIVGESKYSDVNKEIYYYSPIMWATENGIVNGYSNDVFAPDDKITREQFATILYRYANYKSRDISFDSKIVEALKKYEDNSLISDFAKNAMRWAIYSKMINGTSETTIEPQNTTTRAQTATIFMRFDKWVRKTENQTPTHTNDSLNKESENGTSNEENDNTTKDCSSVCLKVNDAEITRGNSVDVTLSLENNPGIMGMIISFEYDEKAMKLVKVLNGDVFADKNGYVFTSPRNMASGCRASWYTLENECTTVSGTFATLVFEVFDYTQKGSYPVTVRYGSDDVIDKNEESVVLDIVNGEITVK